MNWTHGRATAETNRAALAATTAPSVDSLPGAPTSPPGVDSLTGLSSLSEFVERLADVYRHCAERDVRPSKAFAVLVIDADLSGCRPLVRDAVRVLIADEVRRSFAEEETQASIGQRVVVLAAHSSGLRRAANGVVRRLNRLPVLKDIVVRTWIQPLPDTPANINHFALTLGL